MISDTKAPAYPYAEWANKSPSELVCELNRIAGQIEAAKAERDKHLTSALAFAGQRDAIAAQRDALLGACRAAIVACGSPSDRANLPPGVFDAMHVAIKECEGGAS